MNAAYATVPPLKRITSETRAWSNATGSPMIKKVARRKIGDERENKSMLRVRSQPLIL